MGITNPVHLAFVAIIALIVLGPKRLPDLARSLGEGMRSFRESLEGATAPDRDDMLSAAMTQPESPQAPVAEHAGDTTPAFGAEPAPAVGAPPYPHAQDPAEPVRSAGPPATRIDAG
jgi:sec-independent protein translocase protein TatA